MAITLNHTIVPARDKVASAKFLARILGLTFDEGAVGFFAPLRINETLTLDFDEDAEPFDIHHYAFKVSETDFDAMFSRIKAEGITYGSGPHARENLVINHHAGGRGVYFCDPNGHILELLTAE
ncbi:MAG: Glyoxalase/bleomycin resistance protein/dioxygenase [Nitrospira sp.]|nr:Glyoxalase/bleomycin resistance protein/dioxygenase [Nitrospira sp.]